MRVAALIIGIIGSAAGFVAAVIALFIGGVGVALEAEGASKITSLAFGAIGASIVGLVGGALSIAKPESTEGVGRVSVLKRQEGAPLNLG